MGKSRWSFARGNIKSIHVDNRDKVKYSGQTHEINLI